MVKSIVFNTEEERNNYFECKRRIEYISYAIEKIIDSTEKIIFTYIPTSAVDKLHKEYVYCLKHTILSGVDDAGKLIEKYNITNTEQIDELKSIVSCLITKAIRLESDELWDE